MFFCPCGQACRSARTLDVHVAANDFCRGRYTAAEITAAKAAGTLEERPKEDAPGSGDIGGAHIDPLEVWK